jgi:anthranilate phosphoribosyltransferase
VLNQLISKIASSSPLSAMDVQRAVAQLVDPEVPVELKADFLGALSGKGETVEEIAAFALELRTRSLKPELPDSVRGNEILDVVGTGGDRLSTFNISTCVALIASAAGVYVAKHGNRASTSPVGSADVMDALGLPFDLEPAAAAEALARHRFCFLFAPKYHPAFKHIVPARKLCAQRGQTTVFNLLGPLLNPVLPTAVLIGVPRPDLCEPMARVLQSLGVRRGMVVSGSVGDEAGGPRYLDEVSPLGPTTVAEFYHEKGFNRSNLDPAVFPMQPATLPDLRGGDREVNARTIREVLGGRDRGPKRDAVLINSAAALFVAGRTRTLLDGWDLAAQVIDSGLAEAKLKELASSRPLP